MPDFRSPGNYFFGSLTNAAAISDTSLVSTDFAALASIYSANVIFPLTLDDPATKLHEIVWVTAHTAASNTITVVRAKEGTTARAWPAGTRVTCAPTQYDGRLSVQRASLPSDGHTGQNATVTDEGAVVTRGYEGRWEAALGVALPGAFGKRADTSAIPNSGVLVMRGDRRTVNTDGSGLLAATFNTPFPNQCLRVMVTWISGGTTNLFNIGLSSFSSTGCVAYLYNGATGAGAGSGISVTFDYLAVGY
jgi:hypothetical protein